MANIIRVRFFLEVCSISLGLLGLSWERLILGGFFFYLGNLFLGNFLLLFFYGGIFFILIFYIYKIVNIKVKDCI